MSNPSTPSLSKQQENIFDNSGFHYAADTVLPLSSQKKSDFSSDIVSSSTSNLCSILRDLLSFDVYSNIESSSVSSAACDVGEVLYPFNEPITCCVPLLTLHCISAVEHIRTHSFNLVLKIDGSSSIRDMINNGLMNLDSLAHLELNSYQTEYAERMPFFGTLLSEADSAMF
jgi:hypothetical protein